MLINLKHIFNNSSSKSIIFRLPRIIKYKEVSVEGIRTSFHHIVMNWNVIAGSLITETYGEQWAEFRLWVMPKMTSGVPSQGPSLLISAQTFWTHLIIILNAILPNKLKPLIVITVHISRCGKSGSWVYSKLFVQNIPLETVVIIKVTARFHVFAFFFF